MKIFRTEPNEYGWRTKFVIRESMNDISISHENNHKGYWKVADGRSEWCDLDDLKKALEVLTKSTE